MPTAGDRFEMVDGSVYEVLNTAADTGGEFVETIFHQRRARSRHPAHTFQPDRGL